MGIPLVDLEPHVRVEPGGMSQYPFQSARSDAAPLMLGKDFQALNEHSLRPVLEIHGADILPVVFDDEQIYWMRDTTGKEAVLPRFGARIVELLAQQRIGHLVKTTAPAKRALWRLLRSALDDVVGAEFGAVRPPQWPALLSHHKGSRCQARG